MQLLQELGGATERSIETINDLILPMSYALKQLFGDRAPGVAYDLFEAAADPFRELPPSITPPNRPSTLEIVQTLALGTQALGSCESGKAHSKIKFGSLLLLGFIAAGYGGEYGHHSRHHEAYSSSAYEALRGLREPPYPTIVDLLRQFPLASEPERKIISKDISALLFDVALEVGEHRQKPVAIPVDTKRSPSCPSYLAESTTTLHREEVDASDEMWNAITEKMQALPWLDINQAEDQSMPHWYTLGEGTKILAYLVDLAPFNRTTNQLTVEALRNDGIEEFQIMAARMIIECHGIAVRNTQQKGLLYYKKGGSNHRLARSFYMFGGTFNDIKILFHLGTSRTKANEADMLSVLTGNKVRQSSVE